MFCGNLYNLVVPCKGTVKDKSMRVFSSQANFYLNKECIIRLEPSGVIVLPPKKMPNFIYLDNDFKKIFNKNSFSLSGYLRNDIEMLVENRIILKKPNKKKLKFNHFVSKVDGLPVHALLDVTSDCNCNCLSCYHKNDLDGFYPTLEDLKKRIDKLKELGILVIEVTGGEPLLRNDLPEILNYIKQVGLSFYVVTNGEFLTSASNLLVESLQQAKNLAISLDGFGDVHDQVRRREGLFEKLLEGLEFCSLNDISVILVSTLNEKNVDSVPEMSKLAKEYNCILHLRPTIKTGSALDNNVENCYPIERVGKILKEEHIRNGFLGEKKSLTIPCSYYGCGLRRRISVDVYGNIFPCVMDRSRNIGNINSFTEKELFKSLVEEANYFLQRHSNCSKCDKFTKNKKDPVCSGFCRFSKAYKNNLKK